MLEESVSDRFALTDYLGKEYNKPINTDGMIRIYPDVTEKKKRHEQVWIIRIEKGRDARKNDSDCKASSKQE